MSEPALPAPPDSCWPVDTTCFDSAALTPEQRDLAVSLATSALRGLTGYRVGGCPVTVRPCRAADRPPTYRDYPVLGGSGGGLPWGPRLDSGRWSNGGCGGCVGACSCDGPQVLRLPGPGPSRVDAVTIGGATLAPSAYRLESGGRLVRTDGDAWPTRQDMSAPAGSPGVWEVTYLPTVAVDGQGAAAAGVLAAEFAKALCGAKGCALPPTVQTITRNGVTMTLGSEVWPEGRTGIRLVDLYVDRWNPGRLRSPSVVYAVDGPRHRVMPY